MLPQKLYLPIISLFHYSLGHIGEAKLKYYIKNNYYLNNKKYANLICENLSNSCYGCITNKQTNYRFKEGSTNFIKSKRPNETIYLDLLEFPIFEGHLKKNTKNPSAILVIKCVFSSYISLYVINSKRDFEIRNSLSNYFCVHDIPKYMVTDNAKLFKSHLFINYMKKLGVNIVKSSALKSKTRGFIEIAVKRINYFLRMYRQDDKLDPHHTISIIGYMLNHIPYKNQKLSPHNIMFTSLKNLDGKYKKPGQYIFDTKFIIEEDVEKYYELFQKMIIDCRN